MTPRTTPRGGVVSLSGTYVRPLIKPQRPKTAGAEAVERVLREDPTSFSFFQIVRLLERLHPDRAPVGGWADPGRRSTDGHAPGAHRSGTARHGDRCIRPVTGSARTGHPLRPSGNRPDRFGPRRPADLRHGSGPAGETGRKAVRYGPWPGRGPAV